MNRIFSTWFFKVKHVEEIRSAHTSRDMCNRFRWWCVWESKKDPEDSERRRSIWSIWSVFIIHIHIDRFLIQHVFNIVTVLFFLFLSAGLFFFPSFFYKNNNKNDKDNTMGNFMVMLLNGFCTSRWSRCSVAVVGTASPASASRVSKVTKNTKRSVALRGSGRLVSTQYTVPRQREDTLPVLSVLPCAHYGHLYSKNKIVSLFSWILSVQ